MTINQDKTYPIYSIKTLFEVSDGKRDVSATSLMTPEVLTEEQQQAEIHSFRKRIQARFPNATITYLHESIERVKEDTWYQVFAEHYTYAEGRTDEEIKESFRCFIDRKKKENVANGHEETHYKADGDFKGFYNFLGAEDEQRWCLKREGEKVWIYH